MGKQTQGLASIGGSWGVGHPKRGRSGFQLVVVSCARCVGWLGLVILMACKGNTPTETSTLPDLRGEWGYTGFDIRVVGRAPVAGCEISDLVLSLGPWRPTGLFGRTEGGRLTCTGELEPFSMDFPSYPVRRGGSVLNFIAFDIGSPDWRHDGTISGDTMRGTFWIQHPGLRLEGKFRAVLKQPGPGLAATELLPARP